MRNIEKTYVFTSEHALRRSIHKRHPELQPKILDAMFNDMKKFIGWRRDSNGDWHNPDGRINAK